MRYPADPPTVDEIVAVMRHAADDRHGQVLEGGGVEQRLPELAALEFVHLAERRVGDNLLDAAAQVGARHGPRA